MGQDLLLPAFAAFPLLLTLINLAQEGASAGLQAVCGGIRSWIDQCVRALSVLHFRVLRLPMCFHLSSQIRLTPVVSSVELTEGALAKHCKEARGRKPITSFLVDKAKGRWSSMLSGPVAYHSSACCYALLNGVVASSTNERTVELKHLRLFFRVDALSS